MWSLSKWIRGDVGQGSGPSVPALRDALPQIVAEFQRARRYERTLTVAVFTIEGDRGAHRDGSQRGRPVGGGGHGDGQRFDQDGAVMPAALASALRRAMRETDLVAWDGPTRSCVVVMPEIGAQEGRSAVDRMRAFCRDRLACPPHAGIAEFPGDGWTFEDLVAAARRHDRAMSKEREPRAEPRAARVEPVAVTADK